MNLRRFLRPKGFGWGNSSALFLVLDVHRAEAGKSRRINPLTKKRDVHAKSGSIDAFLRIRDCTHEIELDFSASKKQKHFDAQIKVLDSLLGDLARFRVEYDEAFTDLVSEGYVK